LPKVTNLYSAFVIIVHKSGIYFKELYFNSYL